MAFRREGKKPLDVSSKMAGIQLEKKLLEDGCNTACMASKNNQGKKTLANKTAGIQ